MDMADIAARVSALHLTNSLRNLFSRQRDEEPEYNDKGERTCVDCGIVIPAERVEQVDAVRCVDCQDVLEKQRRNYT